MIASEGGTFPCRFPNGPVRTVAESGGMDDADALERLLREATLASALPATAQATSRAKFSDSPTKGGCR